MRGRGGETKKMSRCCGFSKKRSGPQAVIKSEEALLQRMKNRRIGYSFLSSSPCVVVAADWQWQSVSNYGSFAYIRRRGKGQKNKEEGNFPIHKRRRTRRYFWPSFYEKVLLNARRQPPPFQSRVGSVAVRYLKSTPFGPKVCSRHDFPRSKCLENSKLRRDEFLSETTKMLVVSYSFRPFLSEK